MFSDGYYSGDYPFASSKSSIASSDDELISTAPLGVVCPQYRLSRASLILPPIDIYYGGSDTLPDIDFTLQGTTPLISYVKI